MPFAQKLAWERFANSANQMFYCGVDPVSPNFPAVVYKDVSTEPGSIVWMDMSVVPNKHFNEMAEFFNIYLERMYSALLIKKEALIVVRQVTLCVDVAIGRTECEKVDVVESIDGATGVICSTIVNPYIAKHYKEGDTLKLLHE